MILQHQPQHDSVRVWLHISLNFYLRSMYALVGQRGDFGKLITLEIQSYYSAKETNHDIKRCNSTLHSI